MFPVLEDPKWQEEIKMRRDASRMWTIGRKRAYIKALLLQKQIFICEGCAERMVWSQGNIMKKHPDNYEHTVRRIARLAEFGMHPGYYVIQLGNIVCMDCLRRLVKSGNYEYELA